MSDAARDDEVGPAGAVGPDWRAGQPPADAAAPRPPHLVRRALALLWHKVFEDRIFGLAAEAGFWVLVSLPSILLAFFGALGYLHGVIGTSNVALINRDVLRGAGDVLTPATVNSDVAPILDSVLSKGHLGVVSVGFVLSLWSGSTAMADYLNTITVAYGMRGLRPAWRSRLVALGLYLCALVVGIVLLPLLALGPDDITKLFPDTVQDQVSLTIHVLYWPVVAVSSVALLALLYTVCLPVRVKYRRNLPGAVVGMVLWVVLSFGTRTYLTSSFRQHSAYGQLSTPIAGLLFFYFTALAVLLGAELNSAIDAVAPVGTTQAGRARSEQQARTGLEGRRSLDALPSAERPSLADPRPVALPRTTGGGPPDGRRGRRLRRRPRWAPWEEPVPDTGPGEHP